MKYKIKVHSQYDIDKLIKQFNLIVDDNITYNLLGDVTIKKPFYYIIDYLESKCPDDTLGAFMYLNEYKDTFVGWDWGSCDSPENKRCKLLKLIKKEKLWKIKN